jgi:hypothetical protein
MTKALVAVTLVVGAAVVAPAASAQSPAGDSVTGSASTCDLPPICFHPLSVNLDAHSGANGESPTGTAEWRKIAGTFFILGAAGPVKCLAVSGKTAIIGFSSPETGRNLVRVSDGGSAQGQDSFEVLWEFVPMTPVTLPPPDCSSFSPSTFPGTTKMTWSGANDIGDIVVRDVVPDRTPPVLTVPNDITVKAQNLAGARVTYTASATDNVDPAPDVVCTPPSGTAFPIGKTTVTCTASDNAGNTATKSFNIVVRLPVGKNECRNGGWRSFGTVFKNEGDCVSFVATGGRNQPAGPPA